MLAMPSCSIGSLILVGIVLSGCAPHEQYRTDPALCTSSRPEQACQKNFLQEYTDPTNPDRQYLLAFIEFDDQGQIHERDQMNTVLTKLNQDAAAKDLLVVIFIHGWKHSAAPTDGNIKTLRENLQRLSALESDLSRREERPERKVVGVYLAWRGGSVTVPLVKELTFWDRKNTAHKVGHGGVTEVLGKLEEVKKVKAAIAEPGRESNTRLVIIGHSFGGAVAYSALSQILMARFVETLGPTGTASTVEGFGDLVVLINPAFEAIRFATLSDMANERRSYFSTQLPVMAILTSEADDATKRAFPLGRWFSTLFEKHREAGRTNGVTGTEEMVDQRKANVTAVGHFEPYKTHVLRPAEVSAKKAGLELFRVVSQNWENDVPGSVIEFEGSVLERTAMSVGRNPYLVIRVDKELIRDHNHIDDPRMTSFIRQLILVASQSDDPVERTMLRTRAFGE